MSNNFATEIFIRRKKYPLKIFNRNLEDQTLKFKPQEFKALWILKTFTVSFNGSSPLFENVRAAMDYAIT